MNIYGAKELAAAFRTVRKNTIVIAEEVGEEHYGFRAAADCRSIGETLVHITNICKMAQQIHRVEKLTSLASFDFMGFLGPLIADEKTPRTKAEIIANLTAGGEDFAAWLEGLSDEFLAELVAYPAGMVPPTKTRFEMLLGVKEHEMHHRGQLMMMQRMVGVVPHLTRAFQERIAAMSAKA